MTVRATGRRWRDHGKQTENIEYLAGVERVQICLPDEAIDDHTEAVALAFGERKLRDAVSRGTIPREVFVSTWELYRATG